MATALSTERKKSIRDKLKAKVKTAGYTKGHVAQTKGKKISDIKPVKKKEKTDLKDKFKGKTDSAGYKKAVQARKHAKAVKKSMQTKKAKGDEKGRTVIQKTYAQAAKKGAKMAHRKKVHDPKGTHKAWRKTAMQKAKKLKGTAKRDAMRKVGNTYRKKIGLKAKTYT
jgi:hypothetical protein